VFAAAAGRRTFFDMDSASVHETAHDAAPATPGDSAPEIVVVEIDRSPEAFLRRELDQQQAEIARLPEWILAPEFRRVERGRKWCHNGHLFVNALSKFCHVCGDVR